MPSPRNRGADALALALAAAGVKRLFTLSGNHVMPVFDACLDAGIALVHVRHEAAAVHMADAWARLTGEVGVALVTGGPGHANAVGALYTAAMAESPVVLLSGHAPRSQLGMGAFQEMPQEAIAAPLCKRSLTSASADRVAIDFGEAVRTARSGRAGPVHLSLPQDALDNPADRQLVPLQAGYAPEAMPLDESAAQGLIARLATAHRPLVLCGPASATAAGRARMAALEQASGVPVIAMESPRGIADPSLGAFGQVLAQADVVLLVGKRLDFTLRFGAAPAMPADCEFLQVDAEDLEIERTRRAVGSRLVQHAKAEAASALVALQRAARGGDASHAAWRAEVASAIRYRPAAWDEVRATAQGRLHPVEALRPVQAILEKHPEAVLVCDGGEFGQWAQACLAARHRVINGVAGSIGSALPFAVAARLAKPQGPVIAILGDGTFGFHPAELDTAVRHGAPFVAVVGNDARWNAEYQIQLRDSVPIGCSAASCCPRGTTRWPSGSAGMASA